MKLVFYISENQHRDREEEKKALMEKLQDFQAQAERIPDLEQKVNLIMVSSP